MLIHDKEHHEYYGFEIKHSKEAVKEQYQYLCNKELTEVLDKQYDRRKNVAVLYRGNPFYSSDGVYYLNVNTFLRALDKTHDIRLTMDKLTADLETVDVQSAQNKDSFDQEVIKLSSQVKKL